MKVYKFELTVREQSDEFWEEITDNGKSGCDEVRKLVLDMLTEAFIDADIRLIGYEDE